MDFICTRSCSLLFTSGANLQTIIFNRLSLLIRTKVYYNGTSHSARRRPYIWPVCKYILIPVIMKFSYQQPVWEKNAQTGQMDGRYESFIPIPAILAGLRVAKYGN